VADGGNSHLRVGFKGEGSNGFDRPVQLVHVDDVEEVDNQGPSLGGGGTPWARMILLGVHPLLPITGGASLCCGPGKHEEPAIGVPKQDAMWPVKVNERDGNVQVLTKVRRERVLDRLGLEAALAQDAAGGGPTHYPERGSLHSQHIDVPPHSWREDPIRGLPNRQHPRLRSRGEVNPPNPTAHTNKQTENPIYSCSVDLDTNSRFQFPAIME